MSMMYVCIGGWGVSPNREISMAPASVILRLGFWRSISAPGGRVGVGVPLMSSSRFTWVRMCSNEF